MFSRLPVQLDDGVADSPGSGHRAAAADVAEQFITRHLADTTARNSQTPVGRQARGARRAMKQALQPTAAAKFALPTTKIRQSTQNHRRPKSLQSR